MSSAPILSKRAKRWTLIVGAIIALIVGVSIWVNTYTEYLWFQEVEYTEVFSTVLQTKLLLFFLFGVIMALIVAANMIVAYRLRENVVSLSPEQQALERYRMKITPLFGWAVGGVALLVGIIAGTSAKGRWEEWLLFWNSEKFGVKDPQFGKDVSFYVFQYPMFRYILTMAFAVVTVCIISAIVIHYLYGGLRLSGSGPRMSQRVIVHLSILLGIFVGLKAIAYYLDRFGLLVTQSASDKIDGASAADIEYLLPAKNILMWIAALCALMFILNVGVRKMLIPGMALALLLIAAVVAGGIVPSAAERFAIKPSADTREAEYIDRNIAATRASFELDNVKRTPYPAKTTATPEEIRSNVNTLPNTRLLDPNIVSQAFVQLQQVRSFYDFNKQLDIDRYTIDGEQRDYVTGVRELNTSQLSGNQTNWVNKHTVYTHGYGFVAAPSNQVDDAGAPVFVSGDLGEGFDSDAAKKFSDAVGLKQPRVYYGEQITDYSVVGKEDGAKDQELDRPTASGEDGEQINTTYDGKGGVKLDTITRKMLYGLKFREKNLLLSESVNDNSKIMYVRNPRDRVEKAAPFLTADSDPYPAVVDGRIVWIIDAYTTTDAYPYAEHTSIGDAAEDSRTGEGTAAQASKRVNYMRNSVKAVVDAYDGTVDLYEWDKKDPLLKAWNSAFDGIVKKRSEMSKELLEHVRYPADLMKVQRSMYSKYHVTNPREFFNGQDFWKIPEDPTRQGKAAQPPYYLLAQFPEQETGNFQLTTAFTAAKRENLTAMMTGWYDKDMNTQLEVVELPGDSAIPGPNQAVPKMRNEANVRRELTQLTSGESQVVYGNLLTLPVGGGLLYVEPIYVQNTDNNAYPLLEKVLLLFGDQIAYEKTLPEALDSLFGPGAAPEDIPDTPGEEDPDQREPGDQPDEPGDEPDEPDEPSGNQAEVDAAVADIKAALDKLGKAQADRDYAGIGQAEKELDAAVKRFQDATKE